MLEHRHRSANRGIELPLPQWMAVALVEGHHASISATAKQQATRGADEAGIAGVWPLAAPDELLRGHIQRRDDAAAGHVDASERAAEIRLTRARHHILLATAAHDAHGVVGADVQH